KIISRAGITLMVLLSVSGLYLPAVANAAASPSLADATGSPTIVSDKADYQAGSTVTLTGAGWASGETVHIYVNDSAGQTWSLDSGQNGAAPDPVADAGGSFTYQFQLPLWFVANYSVLATGAASGQASTTFTDAAGANLDQCANGKSLSS